MHFEFIYAFKAFELCGDAEYFPNINVLDLEPQSLFSEACEMTYLFIHTSYREIHNLHRKNGF
jgi:hypothetical protein